MLLNDDHPAEEIEAAILGELARAGFKATAQRRAIVRALVNDTSHPTAQALFARLSPVLTGVSFATVYNTLAALTAIGRVRPMTVGGPTRFDTNVTPHHHAICDECGAVTDVPIGARPRPARLSGFEVRQVEHIYRGICAACRPRAAS